MSVLPCDADGYAIPAADLLSDFLHDTDCCDFQWNEPELWDEWTDEWIWVLGPGTPDEEPFHPTPGGRSRARGFARAARLRARLQRPVGVTPSLPCPEPATAGSLSRQAGRFISRA